ncbi:hypothetical protein [Tolypothrix sp. NIES-4075]|nr:hypothetical protein [Tolypothrix sp. NIES-4075]
MKAESHHRRSLHYQYEQEVHRFFCQSVEVSGLMTTKVEFGTVSSESL